MMNIAMPFVNQFKYINEDNIQLNINYKPKIKELDTFINQYGEKHRINLLIKNFDEKRDIPILEALLEKYNSYELIVCIPFYSRDIEELLNLHKIKHYYNEFVNTWDKFIGFLNLDVTDIFIADELCFSMDVLAEKAKEYNKDLRAYCNICQSSWPYTPSFKTFFIRPEDLRLYDNYIDTIEFYVSDIDYVKINTLYEIYCKDHFWYGKLSDLIVGYEGEEDSRFIIPSFGVMRRDCDKICLTRSKRCESCDRVQKLEKELRNAKIAIAPFDKK